MVYDNIFEEAGFPIWRDGAEKASFPKLIGDTKTDVVIVGAGITGITTAFLLKESGLRVVVVEALKIGSGTTGCTTAHFTQIGDLEIGQLIKNFNEEDISLTVKAIGEAIDLVERLAGLYMIDCGFRRLDAYQYTEKEEETEQLRQEFEASRKVGLDVHILESTPLPYPVKIALQYPKQAHFHTLRFIYALANKIADVRNFIYEDSRVIKVDGDGPYRLYTESGSIEADHVIYATHTPLMINPVQMEMIPGRSYVVGVRLEGQQLEDALYWDNEDPYHYICKFNEKGQDYVIIGGADHKQGEEVNEREHMAEIERWAKHKFKVASVDYRWSGQEYTPADGLPYIGKSPFADRIYIATGFSGNGISYGVVAAMLLRDMITGNKNRLEDIFSPSRFKPIAGYKTMFEENASAVKNLFFERFGQEKLSFDDIPFGHGRILSHDGKNMAVYKDENGGIHKMSPFCKHAGCIVRWNDFEKSWDCSCHGSRFFPDGKVMEGPALDGLEKIE